MSCAKAPAQPSVQAAYLEQLAVERLVRRQMQPAVSGTEDSSYHNAACRMRLVSGSIQCR